MLRACRQKEAFHPRFYLFLSCPSFPPKAIPDEMSPEEILAQARSASSRAKRNLDTAQKKVRVGFLRKKEKMGMPAYAEAVSILAFITSFIISKIAKHVSLWAYLHECQMSKFERICDVYFDVTSWVRFL